MRAISTWYDVCCFDFIYDQFWVCCVLFLYDDCNLGRDEIFINFLRCIKGSTRLPFIRSTCRLPWLCWSLVFETEQHMTLHEKLCCWKLSRRTQRAHAYTIHICNMCSVHITWRKNRCVSKKYSIQKISGYFCWPYVLESFPTAQPQRQPSPDDMMAICQCELQSRMIWKSRGIDDHHGIACTKRQKKMLHGLVVLHLIRSSYNFIHPSYIP